MKYKLVKWRINLHLYDSQTRISKWHIVNPTNSWRTLCGKRIPSLSDPKYNEVDDISEYIHDETICMACIRYLHKFEIQKAEERNG